MEKKKKYLLIGVIAVVLINNNQQKQESQKNQEQNNTIDYNEINLNDMGILDNVEVEGDIKTNTSEALLADRTFDGLTIKNISLESDKGTTTFKATAVNNTDNVYAAKEIKITLLDKDGQEYGTLNALIEEIQPGGERTIDASTNIDLSNAYNFKIEEIQ